MPSSAKHARRLRSHSAGVSNLASAGRDVGPRRVLDRVREAAVSVGPRGEPVPQRRQALGGIPWCKGSSRRPFRGNRGSSGTCRVAFAALWMERSGDQDERCDPARHPADEDADEAAVVRLARRVDPAGVDTQFTLERVQQVTGEEHVVSGRGIRRARPCGLAVSLRKSLRSRRKSCHTRKDRTAHPDISTSVRGHGTTTPAGTAARAGIAHGTYTVYSRVSPLDVTVRSDVAPAGTGDGRWSAPDDGSSLARLTLLARPGPSARLTPLARRAG